MDETSYYILIVTTAWRIAHAITKMEWHALIRVGLGCLLTRQRVESQCGFTVGAHTIGRQWQEKLWGLLGSLLRWLTSDSTYRCEQLVHRLGHATISAISGYDVLKSQQVTSPVVPGNKSRSDDVPLALYEFSGGLSVGGIQMNRLGGAHWRTLNLHQERRRNELHYFS